VEAEICEILKESGGEPFSFREIHRLMSNADKKHNPRTIDKYLKKLIGDPFSGVKMKRVGKSYVVWFSWALPQVAGLTGLNQLATSGQYPIHQIITKINEVEKAREMYFTETKGRKPEQSANGLAGSTKEVLWWSGDFSVFKELKDDIVSFLKRGGTLRILMNITRFSSQNAMDILDLKKQYPNLEVRHWESYWRGAIFDRKKVLLIEKEPKAPKATMEVSNGKPSPPGKFNFRSWILKGSSQNMAPWVNWFVMIWNSHWEKAAIGPKVEALIGML